MSVPLIEIRNFFRLWTRDDAVKNIQSVRLPKGPVGPDGQQPTDLYVHVALQYRFQTKVTLEEGKKAFGWSEWADVAIVREDDDGDPERQLNS